MQQPVFTIAFDFAKFFHQLRFRPEELWKMGAMMPMAGPDGAAGGREHMARAHM